MATRTDTLLSAKGICLEFGSNVVLRDVNAEIRKLDRPGYTEGQVVAVLGPSGIGKSLFLRILAGLQKPTRGSVLVGQKQEPVKAGMVGMVAQRFPLYHNRTVMGNLMVAALQRYPWWGVFDADTRRKSQAVCEQSLAQFCLADKRDKYPAELSGGQQQRVAIAQQLLCSDHFVLLDEPTTGLDPVSKDKVCRLLTEVAGADGLNTLIMVTHDIPSALAVADTVWLVGRDRDAAGNIIPGARIVEEYDLIKLGLAWHAEVHKTPEFVALLHELQDRFQYL